ncbi:Na+/H+ antiporter NhaC family protein [Bacillus sp. CGMCC 1.16607]|uniref:Na+/H+ antiporter NhaC family protein n=1 Tax=Bacillus sp. CGMCC 1.16607 TaxID=3351842 RepID=UPI00363CCFB7
MSIFTEGGATLKFSILQIIGLFTITLAGVLLAVTFQKPLVIGFLPGFLVLIVLAQLRGYSLQQIFNICKDGVRRTSGVIWILFLVGFLLPSWYLSGTIDQMVSISLKFITTEHFFTLTFIIALFFSMILGTSVGTLSAIGIPIMGSALTLDLPTGMVAGALISGAFVGDRTSPFSSAHQLLAHTLEIPVRKQFRSMAITTFLTVISGVIFYCFFDYQLLNDRPYIEANGKITFSLFTLIPPAILIIMVLFRLKILHSFIVSISSASLISILNGVEIKNLILSLWYGIEGLGGGLANMYLLLLFLGLAGAYNGLLEELKVVQSILDQWLKSSRTLVSDTTKVMLASFGITLIAANQTLPIILTGRSFLSHWTSKYSNAELARVMGDTTMIFPGIVPWSILTIMCSTIVGVSIFDYIPYAIFLWLLPIVTIFVSVYKNKKEKRAVFNR